MALNPDRFAKIAESLRQYRRAELSDFQSDVGGNPVELLYVDPLESDAVLKTVLLNNTTFLVGRKGTGKSTVFAKAQVELRKQADAVSVYVDGGRRESGEAFSRGDSNSPHDFSEGEGS